MMFLADPLVVDALGYLAAGIVFLSFCMKTMLTLRVIAIVSNAAFICYALAAGLTPILVLHSALLPMNVMRLVQMQLLVRKASVATESASGDERFAWLVPYGTQRDLPAGGSLFRKGDPADRLYVIITGKLVLPEVGVTLGPGAMLGEVALFSGEGQRTASAEALTPVRLAEITERRFREIYFDNPRFAYRLVRLITRRLMRNIRRLEGESADPVAPAMTEPEPAHATRGLRPNAQAIEVCVPK
jgi:CRP-like cAMP-binding protein